MNWKFPLLFTLTMAASQAWGFMTTQESNDITPKGQFKLGFEPQMRLSDGGGANFSGFFDLPVNEEMSARANLGSGETDFHAGGSFKWVPIPDYGNQPSLGGKVSLIHWRESSDSFMTLRLEPIVSKKFESQNGTFIPYGALPVMFNSGNDNNKTGIQVVAGSEYRHPHADNMTFGAELGLTAKDSFSYISGYVTIYLEDNR
ncbi:MAG: hypothetical protein ACAH59_05055 [Pseudobdellovibrionaceae bacterium]